MADIRISQLTAKSSNLASTDELAIAEFVSGTTYTSKKITGAEIKGSITEIEFNTQSATYTLVLADQNKMIEINNASANQITIPLNSVVAFPIGTQILVVQLGAGQTSIGKSVGVNLYAEGNKLKLVGQYAMATIIKKSADLWYVAGNLEA